MIQLTAEELIGRFSRCAKFPDTDMGVIYLAEGLKSASDACGVTMAAIVAKCAMQSRFCPTDFELLETGRLLRAESDRLEVEHSQPMWKRESRCRKCQGTGWQTFTTRMGYSAAYRCKSGCAIPDPSGYMLTPEKLR